MSNEAVTSWCPQEIHNLGGNPPVIRKLLQPDLRAEAFTFIILYWSGSGSRYHQHHKGGVSSPLACGRNPASREVPLPSLPVCWWWCLLTASLGGSSLPGTRIADEESAHLRALDPGECSAGCRAQRGVAAWTGAGVFPVWGMNLQCNWSNRVYIFVQFQVVLSPLSVPPRSVRHITSPYSAFLYFRLGIPSCAVFSFNFHFSSPTILTFAACVLLDFPCLFKK